MTLPLLSGFRPTCLGKSCKEWKELKGAELHFYPRNEKEEIIFCLLSFVQTNKLKCEQAKELRWTRFENTGDRVLNVFPKNYWLGIRTVSKIPRGMICFWGFIEFLLQVFEISGGSCLNHPTLHFCVHLCFKLSAGSSNGRHQLSKRCNCYTLPCTINKISRIKSVRLKKTKARAFCFRFGRIKFVKNTFSN